MRAFRGLLLPALLLLLAACGSTEPRYMHRTAASWVEQLFSGSGPDVTEAADALLRFAKADPDVVIAALEARLRASPPRPAGTPFSLAIDRDGGRRIGLEETVPGEAVQSVLAGIRKRIQGLELVPASVKATNRQEIDLVIPGARERPEAERIQALLATRAALDLRVVVPDPAAAPPGAARSPVYDGKEPFAAMKEGEVRRFLETRRTGTPYTASPWRAVPRAGTIAAGPDDFLIVEEPTEPRDALDERMVKAATPGTTAAGEPTLTLEVASDRVEDVRRIALRNAGLELAVVVDGEVRARMPIPATDGARLTIPLGPARKEATAYAREWSVLVMGGRLPWPLKPVPISARYFADPAPENPLSRVFAAIGPPAAPALRRLASDASAPSWGQASAKWALEQLGP